MSPRLSGSCMPLTWIGLLFLASQSSAQDDWMPGQYGCPTPEAYDCAPYAGTPVSFAGDDGPMRIRKSIWALNDAELAELRLAFERFRAMPLEDPIGYQGFANVHCWNCASPASHLGPETAPEDVHATWAFLPFHRSYVYALEKVLGMLVDNPAFALPYWDWDTRDTSGCEGHQRLPLPYQPQLVPGSGGVVNSLWDQNRGVTEEDSMCPASVGDTRIDLITSLYDTFPLFFGTDNCGSALWHGAHGYIHIWAGGLINAQTDNGPMAISCPDMGMLGTAGRDPLFYSHHANVDRIWDLWISKNGVPDYPQDFLDQSWNFWMPGPRGLDGERQLVTFTAKDGALRSERMHYRYAEPSCDADAPVRLMPEGATPLDPKGSSFTTAEAKPRYSMGGRTGSHVVLHLDDLTIPAYEAGILRVFLDQPGSNAPSLCDSSNVPEQYLPSYRCADSEHLIEELYVVSKSGIPDPPTKTCIQLVLCPDLAQSVAERNGSATVHIVPVGLDADGVPSGSPPGTGISVSQPYFTVED
jgi:Common central domain of tyrosinase